MFNKIEKSLNWGDRELSLETGKIARQADGAVICRYGDTAVLATVCCNKKVNPDIDFFPLMVIYQEKTYAAGKIPGGFFKREGKPSEKETLVSRLIDRPLRPLFLDGFSNEVQVICTVLSFDGENDPDIVAMIAASAALTISGLPFLGPIGAARVGVIDGEFVLNPKTSNMSETKLDLVAASTKNAVMMVESEAHELSKEQMLDAIMFAKKASDDVIDLIIDFAEDAAKEAWEFSPPDHSEICAELNKNYGKEMEEYYNITSKFERSTKLAELRAKIVADICANEENELTEVEIKKAIKKIESSLVRTAILEKNKRIDGRKLDEIRQIECEVSAFPRSHGSAIFTRGETQAMVFTTLGTGEDEQMLDMLEGMKKESFMLHYNFPPYSVGEVGRFMGPGRREIGHGKLAWRALHPLLPSQEKFPYVLRLVSEITESNGSSSMATVCGSSLSLMDAGVPIKTHVAGIAMGLILEGSKFAVLSDILGDEDHLGDMDFKVAGTNEGITSLQMDIKIAGITKEIMEKALEQAVKGIDHILGKMNEQISEPRKDVSEFSPRIEQFTIKTEKIREVIGTGGKVIREIMEKTNVKIDINDDGVIKIYATDRQNLIDAKKWVKSITDDPEIGHIYKGKVVKIVDFGAFVNFFGQRDGLVHISQISEERIKKVEDVLKEGQNVFVKYIGDDRGKVKLSMKMVDQETGEEIK